MGHVNMRLPLISLLSLPLLVLADSENSSSEVASSRQSDGYGAPYAPPQQYQSRPSYDTQPKHDYDYYKHEHHHYYHAGPPRVYKVPVPVTQKPHIVHVPQNVPVKFVGVNVPVPPPVQYVGQPVEITPQHGGVYHHSGDFDDPYIKRKELIKSGLLSGAGVLKGALITTLINNANNNNGK